LDHDVVDNPENAAENAQEPIYERAFLPDRNSESQCREVGEQGQESSVG